MARTKFGKKIHENKSDDEVILRRKPDPGYGTTSSGDVTPDCIITDFVDCGNAILLIKTSNHAQGGLSSYREKKEKDDLVLMRSASTRSYHGHRSSKNIEPSWPCSPDSSHDDSPKSSEVSSSGSGSSIGSSSVTFLRRSLSNMWRKSFNRSKRSSYKTSTGSGSSSSSNSSTCSTSSAYTSSCCSGSDRPDGVKDFSQIGEVDLSSLIITEISSDSLADISCDIDNSLKCDYDRANGDKDNNAKIFNAQRRNSTDMSGLNLRSANSICVGIRSAPSSPMAPLQGQSDTHGQSVVSLTTLSRSPSHHNATKLDSKSLKLRTSPGSAPRIRNEIPEKKRKELSSSREKKFHRHFQQVSKEERLINYFSCALVSDFLLQGHLYITENYFAFYSNVFGFVTKLLIPTATVIKISKEKTAKIIPNAVGVTTADERHVFGSFMSRETAFRLMCSVCPPLEPIERIPKVPDVEVSEECSVEDDSSCSISGNESPPQIISCTPEPTTQRIRQRSIPAHIAPDVVDSPKELVSTLTTAKPLIAAPVTWAKSPPPRIVSTSNRKINPIYIGVILTIVLAIFSAYLYHKVCEMESMINYSPPNYKIDPDNDLDVYAETFKWQKEMELKSAQEIQSLINSHLELIARLRKSLENLSLLIHQHNIMFDTIRQRSTVDRPSGVDDASSMEQHLTT